MMCLSSISWRAAAGSAGLTVLVFVPYVRIGDVISREMTEGQDRPEAETVPFSA